MNEVYIELAKIAAAIASVLLLVGKVYAVKLIKEKFGGEVAAQAAGKLFDAVRMASADLGDKLQAKIQEKGEDGVITDEEWDEITAEMKSEARAYLGKKGLETLVKDTGSLADAEARIALAVKDRLSEEKKRPSKTK